MFRLYLWLIPALPAHVTDTCSRPECDEKGTFRSEKDSMGEIDVPSWAYWGASTQRSFENFKIGIDKMPKTLLRAFGIQKHACAEANRELMGDKVTDGIIKAAKKLAANEDDIIDYHFPLVVYQTGSGTQTNMNVNEVLANIANESFGQPRGTRKPVHPNDHVNRGQSTNDGFPTAMHIATVLDIRETLIPALDRLQKGLRGKEAQFVDHVKIGRTHMQDATPLTLGQEFSAWATQIEIGRERLHDSLKRLYPLAQGGTAVGTGLNTMEGFAENTAAEVAKITGYPFVTARNKFEAIAAHDAMAEICGTLTVIAGSFMKIANDIRLLGSGPTGGLGELQLPANEPGSSIMPGKVNPTQAEAMSMVAAQVTGNCVAVTMANSHGHLDLQAFKPVIIFNVLKSIQLLADAANSFQDKCVIGIQANCAKIKEHLDKNLMLVTALNQHIGYDKAAKIAKTALAEGKTLREVAVDLGIDGKEFDKIMDPKDMIRPTPLKSKKDEL